MLHQTDPMSKDLIIQTVGSHLIVDFNVSNSKIRHPNSEKDYEIRIIIDYNHPQSNINDNNRH